MKLGYFNQYVGRSEHLLVVGSSLLYCLVGITLLVSFQRTIFGLALVLVGVCAFLHHRFPHTAFFRVCDWFGAVAIIVMIAITVRVSLNTGIVFAVAIVVWLVSINGYHRTHDMNAYSVSHTLWHVISTVIAFFILK